MCPPPVGGPCRTARRRPGSAEGSGVRRVCREEGLSVRRRRSRRRAIGTRAPRVTGAPASAGRSVHVVRDQVACGADRAVRQARRDRPGLWHLVHVGRDPGTGREDAGEAAPCRPRQAHAERHLRSLQGPKARRTAERDPVPRPRPGPRGRVPPVPHRQHRATAFDPGRPDPGGPCRPTHRTGRSASRTRNAAQTAHRSVGATATRSTRDSGVGRVRRRGAQHTASAGVASRAPQNGSSGGLSVIGQAPRGRSSRDRRAALPGPLLRRSAGRWLRPHGGGPPALRPR